MEVVDFRNTTLAISNNNPQVAIWGLGSVGGHGTHLPVGTDILLVDYIARRVAERIKQNVYLLPTLPFGTSGGYYNIAGTISLRFSSLMLVVRDVVESLYSNGIRKVALINNLGRITGSTVVPSENHIVKTTIRQLNYDHPNFSSIWVQPLTIAQDELASVFDSAREDVHAGEIETSLMLYLHRKLVKGGEIDYVPQIPAEYLAYLPFTSISRNGVWGRPRLASPEKGKEALEIMIRRTVSYIEQAFMQIEELKRREHASQQL